jgi:glycosyltransferase involved in cell wall biosynthesis
MRICHVNTEIGWGGGEAQTLYLVRGLQAAGHECALYLNRRGRLRRFARQAGVEVRLLPGRRFPNPAPFLYLWREIRRGRFDICHLHTGHAVALGTIATAGDCGIGHVATRRKSNPLGGNWLGWTRHWTALDHVIAVSDQVRRRLLAAGMPPGRISVIHSAVDVERFGGRGNGTGFRREIGAENGDFLVGNISRLTARKGQDLLLEVADRLRRRQPRTRFVLVGEGESKRHLADRIRGLGLEDRVILTGFREDIPEILAGLDCLLFPAACGEGSPGIIKEAMSAGVPVVAVDHPVVREILTSSKNALLFPQGRIDSMMIAIDRLIRSPECGRSLADNARRDARRFSVDRMVARTEAVYDRVLHDRRSRRAV